MPSFSIAARGDGRQMTCVIELPHGEAMEEVVLRLGELEEVRRHVEPLCVRACARKRAQARRAGVDPAGLADRAARGGRLPAGNGGHLP